MNFAARSAGSTFFSTVLFLGAIFMSYTASLAAETERMNRELDHIVAGEISGSPVLSGLQLLVLRGGEVAHEYTGGFARLTNGGPVPLGPDHKARIASISKLVATVGLMRLVEAGTVDLDADVSGYLGFSLRNPGFPGRAITLRMVLSHTSSIRDGAYYWLEAGQRFEDFFLPGRPHFDEGAHFSTEDGQGPGDYFTYANLNFGIVAAVIERVSGTRFDRFMRSEVLEPLGLDASFNVCDLSENHPEHIATLYRKRDENEVWQPDGDWIPQLDDARFSCHYGREPVGRGDAPGEILPGYVMGENPTLFSPQGGLRASARDLAVIAQMLMAGGRHGEVQILQQSSVVAMFARQWEYDPELDNGAPTEGPAPDDPDADRLFAAWGLSVQIMDLAQWGLKERPKLLSGHLGDAYGLMGQFWLDPENGDALIALITGAGDDPDRFRGVSPMYRPSDEIMRWWLKNFPR